MNAVKWSKRDMTKQGKVLEQLVKAIQETIKDMPSTTISTNVKLKDKNGVKRECDVVVETTSQGFTSIIIFECKDYKTPIDIKVVDAFVGKCADLPNVNKKVIVSTSGFSSNAQIKASAYGIALCSLESVNIQELLFDAVATIPMPRVEMGKNLQLVLKEDVDFSTLVYPVAFYAIATNKKLDIRRVIQNYILAFETIAILVKEYLLQDKQSLYKIISMGFENGVYILDIGGEKHLLEKLLIPIKVDFDFIESDIVKQQKMQQGSKNIKVIEHGFGGVDLSCVSIQVDNGNPQAFLKKGDEILSPNFHMSFTKQNAK